MFKNRKVTELQALVARLRKEVSRKVPQVKRQINIDGAYDKIGGVSATLYFTTSERSIVAEAEKFGRVEHWEHNRYRLHPDSRYDFQEIIEYLRSFE